MFNPFKSYIAYNSAQQEHNKMSDSYKSCTIDLTPEAQVEPPNFVTFPSAEPPTALRQIIDELGLVEHVEGGYFRETDRSPFTMEIDADAELKEESSHNKRTVKRNYSTLIYYLLTPNSPIGKLHKNKNRIIHILHQGRGQFVLIYPGGRVKSFKVGPDHANGEVSQWVVPGDVYKASFLLPNDEFSNGLLISEVVVPGFEYEDCSFMSGEDELRQLVGEENCEKLKFLL